MMPDQDVGWIAMNRRPFSDFAVGSLVPAVFEGYARILHPAWASPGVPVRWATVAAWASRHIDSLAQWDFISRPKGEPGGGPAPFAAHPDKNGLPPWQLAALCELLATHTNTPELCFVGVWEGYGWHDDWSASPTLRLDQRTFLVRQGPLGLALAVGRGGPNGGITIVPPSLIWPADRAWFVASDPDLDSTYLGGSNALIEAVVTHPDLEAWRATAGDLVAIGSDETNAE